jgi:hypothetical protein
MHECNADLKTILNSLKREKMYKSMDGKEPRRKYYHLDFEGLTAMALKASVVCSRISYNSVKVNRRLGEHIASVFRVEE